VIQKYNSLLISDVKCTLSIILRSLIQCLYVIVLTVNISSGWGENDCDEREAGWILPTFCVPPCKEL